MQIKVKVQQRRSGTMKLLHVNNAILFVHRIVALRCSAKPQAFLIKEIYHGVAKLKIQDLRNTPEQK